MALPQIVAGGRFGAGNEAAGNLVLAEPRTQRQSFNRVPVMVAGGERTALVGSCRVAAQQQLNLAHLGKPGGPIQGAQGAHTADGVADRDLVGGLALVLLMDKRLDRLVGREGLGLQPRHQAPDVVFALVGAQAAQELGGQRDRQRRVVPSERPQHPGLIHRLVRRTEELIGPGVRLLT